MYAGRRGRVRLGARLKAVGAGGLSVCFALLDLLPCLLLRLLTHYARAMHEALPCPIGTYTTWTVDFLKARTAEAMTFNPLPIRPIQAQGHLAGKAYSR